jgi:hypothetical protein
MMTASFHVRQERYRLICGVQLFIVGTDSGALIVEVPQSTSPADVDAKHLFFVLRVRR